MPRLTAGPNAVSALSLGTVDRDRSSALSGDVAYPIVLMGIAFLQERRGSVLGITSLQERFGISSFKECVMRWIVALLVVVGLVADVQAGLFRHRKERARVVVQDKSPVQKSAVQKEPTQKSPVQKIGEAVQKGPQATAVQKAERAARLGIRHHQGGGFGGGAAEGIGFSTYSAQAALNACCFTGSRVCIGQHVARGIGGWYAVRIFK